MFWKDKIENKITSIQSNIKSIEDILELIKRKVNDDLASKEGRLNGYVENYLKVEKENEKLKSEVSAYKADADKHYEDVGTISGLQDAIEDYKSQLSDYESLKKQNETLTKQIEHLQATIKILDPLVKSQDETIGFLKEQKNTSEANLTELRNCFSAVLRGMYDREEIEFAALKTYRGWKFIYSNGVTTEDFSNTNSVEISWNNGEFVKLSINN